MTYHQSLVEASRRLIPGEDRESLRRQTAWRHAVILEDLRLARERAGHAGPRAVELESK